MTETERWTIGYFREAVPDIAGGPGGDAYSATATALRGA